VSADPADLHPLVSVAATGTEEDLSNRLLETSAHEFRRLRYGRGHSILHAAVMNADRPGVVLALARAGARVDAQDDDGRTPLHHAIDANHEMVARMLLFAGARTDIPNDAGLDAVEFCRSGLREIPGHETCSAVIDLKGR
jgi:hypothetical protein